MMHDYLRAALKAAGLHRDVTALRDLSGGCIHHVIEMMLSDGSRYVAKINRAANLSLFEEEAEGLRALAATKTVLTPEPLSLIEEGGRAVLLMTAIERDQNRSEAHAWQKFGEELATLHNFKPPMTFANPAKPFGFPQDNHIGSTLQPNLWHDDWVEFNALNRLGFQLQLAMDGDLIEAEEADVFGRVINRLDVLIPRHPKPALLHGDLWSGNAIPAANGRVAVIDPACYVGDGWADIAMMKLFGGFPQSCLGAYAGNVEDHELLDTRISVYQLYHLLNHVNIFGRGYVAQAISVAKRLV